MEFPRGSFERTLTIAPADCGGGGVLSPWAILMMMQDAATDACDRIGLTYDVLRGKYGVVFIATGQAVRFARPLNAGETVRVRTDPIRVHGPFFLRQTLFYDAAGDIAAEAQAAWALMDAETGAVRRSTVLRDEFDLRADAAPFCNAAHLHFTTATTECERYTVSAADTDINGHMNNTVYARLLLRCMPEVTTVSEFGIRYRKQAFPGDELTLCRDGETAAGYLDGSLCFDGYVKP